MITSELDSGVNIIEIIESFSPDHEDIVEISPPSVRMERSIREGVGFENAEEEISK